MQTTTSSPQNLGSRPSGLRISILVVGYLVALFGALSIFSVQLYISFLLLIAGGVVATLALRPTPAMTPRSWLVLLAGCVVILVVLYLFGEERVRQWRPHPAGYTPTWFVCFNAFRQIRRVVSHEESPAIKAA